MAWEDYRKMTKRQRRDLTRRAARGDKSAMRQVLSFTNEIKTEVNKRLRNLERAKADYGYAYNNLMFFLNTQYKENRLQSPKKLKYDVYDMMLQNEQGSKFLNSPMSTVRGVRVSETFRITTLQEHNIIPENFSYRKNREFLRFLGSEEISATIDQYGTSDKVVNMLWDAYSATDNKADIIKIMQRAFTEFQAGIITFDEAMERAGIKVEDYYNQQPTS